MGTKERKRGRKSRQMKVTGNAEHVTQASLKDEEDAPPGTSNCFLACTAL